MTFLEYVCCELLGPPDNTVGDRMFWHCPYHGGLDANGVMHDRNPSFSCMPHIEGKKDRFICFGCLMPDGRRCMGDEADLLALKFPHESWPHRQARLLRMRAEYERKPRAGTASSNNFFSSRGNRGCKGQNTPAPVDPRAADMAFADVWPVFQADGIEMELIVKILRPIVEACATNNCPIENLLVYFEKFLVFIKESSEHHLSICDDPQCEAKICRAARGEEA